MSTLYTYGSYILNDGVNTYLLEKPMDFPAVKQIFSKVARLDGMKKTGESLDQLVIPMKIKVVGTSRANLESRLSALKGSLALRQQNLTIYSTDTRYFVADATMAVPKFTTPISADVTITFTCQQPFSYIPGNDTFSTGTITPTGTAPTWVFATQTLNTGGNYPSYPKIRVQQKVTNVNWTGITIFQSTDNYTISTTDPAVMPTSAGDYVDFFCDPNATNGWTVQLNDNGTLGDFTGPFPPIDSTSTSFIVTVTAPTQPQAQLIWTWQDRFV